MLALLIPPLFGLMQVSSASSVSVSSINLCADQLILLLADAEQIHSVSLLAHDRAGSFLYQTAKMFPANDGHSEQVLAEQPDLVIAGQYSPAYTVKLLENVGINVKVLPLATTIESMLGNIQMVSAWVGQQQRGQRIIDSLRVRIDQFDAYPDDPPTAAIYDPNGYSVGADSLRGEMLTLAGLKNIAADIGIESYGHMSLESMVVSSPDIIVDSPYSPGTFSRAQQLTKHPAIRQSGLQPEVVIVPSNMTICAGPWTVDAIEQLQQARRRAQNRVNN